MNDRYHTDGFVYGLDVPAISLAHKTYTVRKPLHADSMFALSRVQWTAPVAIEVIDLGSGRQLTDKPMRDTIVFPVARVFVRSGLIELRLWFSGDVEPFEIQLQGQKMFLADADNTLARSVERRLADGIKDGSAKP